MDDRDREFGDPPNYDGQISHFFTSEVYEMLASMTVPQPHHPPPQRPHSPVLELERHQSPLPQPQATHEDDELVDVEVREDEEDSEFVDSDYEQNPADTSIHVEDDDFTFEENVEAASREEIQSELPPEDPLSDEANTDELISLDGSSSDDEVNQVVKKKKKRLPRFKQFRRATDLRTVKPELGQSYACADDFRAAVKEHFINEGRLYKFPINDYYKVQAKCKADGCPWLIYASMDGKPSRTKPLWVKTFVGTHLCNRDENKNCIRSSWLAERYEDDLRMNPTMDVGIIKAKVRKDYMSDISRWQAYKARSKANLKLVGSYQEQYRKLWDYTAVLRKYNPTSTIKMKTTLEGRKARFQRLYVCFAALRQGFLLGCRPVVGVDGCHLKGPHPGQLLTAVGIDGNNGMFPIAYSVVEIENKSSWSWFLKLLMQDLDIEDGHGWVFMSDKQKGLIGAVESLMPKAEHRHCVRHLYNNFKGRYQGLELKQILWSAARATTIEWFDTELEKMEKLDEHATNWLRDTNASHWSISHFSEDPKCDILLNNLCEAFNASILDARDKPILSMLERIRMYLMLRMANQRAACDKWVGEIGPRIRAIIEKNRVDSSLCIAYYTGEKKYQVEHMHNRIYEVDLARHHCSCRRWNLTGIPCGHAIACIGRRHEDPVLYVHSCYKKDAWKRSYEPFIHPIPNNDQWEKQKDGVEIIPPHYKKQPGRPKKNRIREAGEPPAPPTGNKLPRTYHITISCTKCGEQGHNQRTCGRRKGISAQGQVNDSVSEASTSFVEPTNATYHTPQVEGSNEPPSALVNARPSAPVNATASSSHPVRPTASSSQPNAYMSFPTQSYMTTTRLKKMITKSPAKKRRIWKS